MDQEPGFFRQLAQLVKTSWQHSAPEQGTRLKTIIRWLTPNGGTILIALLLVFTQSVWANNLSSTTNAGLSATTINYQGRLADSTGSPITDDNVPVTFTIYDASEGGNALWNESHVVNIANGLFNVGLGDYTSGGIPTNIWNGDRYLEITVEDETLTPRELIRSVPVAGMALTVPDRAITSSKAALTHGQVFGTVSVLDLTNTPQVVPGLSFTVSATTPQVLQLAITVDTVHQNWDCATLMAAPYVDGVIVYPPMTQWIYPDGNLRISLSTIRQINLPAGNHLIETRAYCEGPSGGQIYANQSHMSYILFSQ